MAFFGKTIRREIETYTFFQETFSCHQFTNILILKLFPGNFVISPFPRMVVSSCTQNISTHSSNAIFVSITLGLRYPGAWNCSNHSFTNLLIFFFFSRKLCHLTISENGGEFMYPKYFRPLHKCNICFHYNMSMKLMSMKCYLHPWKDFWFGF